MSMPTACCTLPPVESNYSEIGREVNLGDLKVYETGDLKSSRLLLGIYDIFGFHPITKQFCDKLGSAGFRVILPDFFRGNAFKMENFPPKDRQVLMDWIAEAGSWEKVVKADFLRLIEHYKGQGVTQIGTFGFCWGALICVEASASEEFSNDIQASVLIHPSFVGAQDGERVKTPVLVLPSKDDADMIPFYENVKAKFGEEGAGHYRFEDQVHGFCAARGDMNDELNRKRVDEALELTNTFMSKFMKK